MYKALTAKFGTGGNRYAGIFRYHCKLGDYDRCQDHHCYCNSDHRVCNHQFSRKETHEETGGERKTR